MKNFGDTEEIRKSCERERADLWPRMERMRPMMEDIARMFYPAAIEGLVRQSEELAEPTQDEDEELLYTTVPRKAFQVGATGFFINLTSPAKRWCKLATRPARFVTGQTEERHAREMDALTEALRYVMRRSGVYKSIETAWKHLLAFGYAAIIVRPEEWTGRYARCETLRPGTYAMGIGADGKVNRLVRRFAFTVEELRDEFGEEALGEDLRLALERGDKARREVWNLIEPHKKLWRGDKRKWKLNYNAYSYRSIWWLPAGGSGEGSGVLAVRGYRYRPFVCPRFECEHGEIYGRSRAWDALGAAKALQTIRSDALDISGQAAQPAVCASWDLQEAGLHLGRGGVNWTAPGEQGANAVYRALREPPSSEQARLDAEVLSGEIKNIFYNSEFASIDALKNQAGVKTATEIEYIRWDNFAQLSGIATTMDEEFLDPLVMLFCNIVLDAGLVALPAGTAREELEIHYESDVHKAQNAADINARNAAMNFAMQLANAKPEVLDNFNFDAAVRAQHRVLGAPEADLKDVRLREQERSARAEEAARQQGIAEEAARAKTFREIASAPATPQTYGGMLRAAEAGAEGAVAR